MVAEERIIFKLKISLWAKIISGVQIVYNSFSAIGSIYGIISLGNLVVYFAYLLLNLFGLATGVLLFLGIKRQKPTFFMAWIGAAAAMIMVYIVGALASSGNIMSIIVAVIAVPIHVFGIYIVYQYKQDVKATIASGGGPSFA